MKLRLPNHSDALSIRRLAVALFVITIVPLVIRAAAPSWWSTRSVLVGNASPDDYAPVNQGQLKNIARAAVAEMDARLTNGAGNELHQMVDAWSDLAPDRNDFAPVNLGQLKIVAKPFYDRLISVGLADAYPWLKSQALPDDFSIANNGQVKSLFNFNIPLANTLDDVRCDRLAASDNSANLALESYGVWIWGNHLIDGTEFERNYPVQIASLSAIKSVAAGQHHLVALQQDGTVRTWGDNSQGQLGDGTYIKQDAPALVPNLANVVSVKAGAAHTLALGQDGTVLAWGDNYYGQLGTGDTTSSAIPVPVAGLDNIIKIAAGVFRSVALKVDTTVWTWGYDHYVGQDIISPIPVQMPGLVDVLEVTAGYEHTVAVKSDGTVWAWGSNYNDQLGNASPRWIFQATPVQVTGLTHITKVASAYDHTLAVQDNGTVWAWGYNGQGQLGDGTDQPRQTPVQVTGLTDVVAIATASFYSLAMKADGTVWAWGDFAPGILPGLNRRIPQQIGLGLLDTNHNGLDDRWELQFFGNLDQAADGDFDGDGVSNLKEFFLRTNPADYYNGIAPIIEIAGGNNQLGDPGTFLVKPYKVRVRSIDGRPLSNAPLTFTITSGGGALAVSPSSTQQQAVAMRTDVNGEAAVYHVLPDAGGISTRTSAIAGPAGAASAVSIRGISRLSPPPPPTPTPDPSATPGPSASPSSTPSATPIAPYRYAIIDLGRYVYPIRVNNKGVILFEGPDANDNWGFCRWKAGVVEGLKPATADRYFKAVDLNDDGTVVGWEEHELLDKPWRWFVPRQVNDFTSGLIWPSNNPVPKVLAGPPTAYWSINLPGSIREADLSAISNRNAVTNQVDLYGRVYLGEGPYLGSNILDFHDILNAHRWSEDLGARTQLSFSSSTVTYNDPFAIIDWHGPMDRVTRANSAGHYIGSRLIPVANTAYTFPPATAGSMIDGQTVDFDPVDINEKGVVVGSNGAGMIIKPPGQSKLVFADSYAISVNDHTRQVASSGAQTSPTATPQPTPLPAPQVLGWTGDALALWELQPNATWHPFGLEEMIPSMDGWNSLDPSDMNDSGLIVGTAWYADPSNPTSPGEPHGFMLVPVELMVDGNRDGRMDSADTGAITEDNPLHFWINNDDDALDMEGTDVPGSLPHNYTTLITSDKNEETGRVNGIRDLVDFLPIHLNIEQLLNLYPIEGASACLFKLKQANGSVNFVYTDLTVETAFDYLRRLTGSELDNATTIGGNEPTNGAVTIHVTKDGVPLETSWLKRARDTRKAVILIEGRSVTKEPLVLEIDDPRGRKITDVRLSLELSEVEEMYRHKNLMGANDKFGGRPDYATGDDTQHAEPENYPDSLCNPKSFVFVHGYNVNVEAARGWGAEMFKRLYWTGSKAKFYSVTWYGSETQIAGSVTTDYQANVDNALATAEQFARFLSTLNNVTVAAHSLGNMLVGSAIHDWGARPSNYFMIDAAVAKESYDEAEQQLTKDGILGMEHPDWLGYDHRLWCPDWHLLFSTADNRSTLTWQGRFKNIDTVTTYNFYSSGEEVLKNPNSYPGVPLSASEVWNKQERMKGRMLTGQILSSNYGGWAFSSMWNIIDATDPENSISRGRTPTETAQITNEQLKSKPFFSPGPDDLYGANGSNYASPQQHRNTLLAEMIPALSFAAGANPLAVLAPPGGKDKNFNMMEYKTGWPRSNPNWQHTDVKIIAYSYIYNLYQHFVELGELRQ